MSNLLSRAAAPGGGVNRLAFGGPGSRPFTGIDVPGPGTDKSQLPATTGDQNGTAEGRRRRGRRGLGGPRKGLAARTVLTSTY